MQGGYIYRFYGGLMEMAESFPTTVISQRTDELSDWVLAGPTCDSIDVLGTHKLPINSQTGICCLFQIWERIARLVERTSMALHPL